MSDDEALFRELEGIRDGYRADVKQFIAFIKERRLALPQAFLAYASWLGAELAAGRYSAATYNRKIAAAKSRLRWAFRHSSAAERLRAGFRLEDLLKEAKAKPLDASPVREERALSLDEARRLAKGTKDRTIGLMIRFLAGTGTRVSEMLGVKLADLAPGGEGLVALRIVGKAGRERSVHAKDSFIDLVRDHFRGGLYLFEHDGRPFSRVSVTNRIKHESLRVLGREVSAQQLRYTWAVAQIRLGKDLRAVASALGRADGGSPAKSSGDAPLVPRESFLDVEAGDHDEAN